MDYNIFVIISTVIFYIILKYFVFENSRKNSKKINYLTLFVPILLYTSKYFNFTSTLSNSDYHSNSVSTSKLLESSKNSDLLSIPYPLSSS